MLVDPLLSLAMSMHAQKGVYAVLLGSGVSRSAKIPTGWEVILDLVSRVAVISGEAHTGEAAAAWYCAQYGELNYSHLLNQLAATPAERQQLLRQYFEPTPEEAEQHFKLPTAAHRAVAELVKGGYVRVILTTNFDRLCERAIENEGITPIVISSPDAAEGATPLAHSSCTVIKLHGDYLDTRLKNIEEELSTYDPRIDRLLDKVLDEYGLIVCGWSAQWDHALRKAFERRKSRRYSIYWIVRGGLTDEARQLLNLCQAREISCSEADTFFPALAAKIVALNDLTISDPLPPKIAAATVKRYLVDDRHRIRLNDLINDLVRNTIEQFGPAHLSLVQEPDINEIRHRMKIYELGTQVLQHVIVPLCQWGGADHESLVTKIMELQGDFSTPNQGGYELWIKMRLYPVLILLYSGGIGAIKSANYRMLHTLFTTPTYHDDRGRCLLFVETFGHAVLRFDLRKDLPGYERRHTPVSDYLFNLLRPVFSETLTEYRYEQCFDYFEFIRGLVHADLGPNDGLSKFWGPPGRYAWKSKSSIVEIIDEEILRLGADWPLLKVGFFEGSIERLNTVLNGFKNTLSKIRMEWHL